MQKKSTTTDSTKRKIAATRTTDSLAAMVMAAPAVVSFGGLEGTGNKSSSSCCPNTLYGTANGEYVATYKNKNKCN